MTLLAPASPILHHPRPQQLSQRISHASAHRTPVPVLTTRAPHRDHAAIELSAGLWTLLCWCHDVDAGLSLTRLGHWGLSLCAAWTAATDTILAAASDEHGVRIHTRPHRGGLEVATDDAPASALLTHPRSFDLLHRHLGQLLGTPNPIYVISETLKAGQQQQLYVFATLSAAHLAHPGCVSIQRQGAFPALIKSSSGP